MVYECLKLKQQVSRLVPRRIFCYRRLATNKQGPAFSAKELKPRDDCNHSLSLLPKASISRSIMAEFKEVDGYDSLKSELKSLEKSDKPVFILFCGSKDSSGKSWCPDCVTADPVVHESVKEKLTDGIFITCHVGPRDYWKNQSNPFRTDPKLKISAVPTLIRLGQSNRLVEEQLFKRDMVDMLFEDD